MLSYPFTDTFCLLSSLLKYAAARINDGNLIVITVSTRSRAEVAAGNLAVRILAFGVSTHSRAEAAALHKLLKTWRPCGFNTQPPEGGCKKWRFLT